LTGAFERHPAIAPYRDALALLKRDAGAEVDIQAP
jgi:hypothetical protein